MAFNTYLDEKLIAERQAQIRQDMQQCRMRMHAGQRRTLVGFTLGSLGTLLIEVGSQLRRASQRSGATFSSS